jgi:hypothetical protein
MAFDNDRNRVLRSLRDKPEGVDNASLIEVLGLSNEMVERHLLYCVDYGLAYWTRTKTSKLAMITPRGRDYLGRQGI